MTQAKVKGSILWGDAQLEGDCPFCNSAISTFMDRSRFVKSVHGEIWNEANCPECSKLVIIAVDLKFDRDRVRSDAETFIESLYKVDGSKKWGPRHPYILIAVQKAEEALMWATKAIDDENKDRLEKLEGGKGNGIDQDGEPQGGVRDE